MRETLYRHSKVVYCLVDTLYCHAETLCCRVGTLFCRAQDEYRNEPGSVITADFYNASALLPLTDEAIVQRVKSHLVTCEPGFRGK